MTAPTPAHRELAAGALGPLSLAEQLANIGSEVGRLRRWRGRDARLATGAFERALELPDLTLADPRWRGCSRRSPAPASCSAMPPPAAASTALRWRRSSVPFALLYAITPDGVRILAVMNLKRRPTYWIGRE